MLRLFQICVVPPPTHLLSHFLDQAAQPASPTSRWPALKSKKSKTTYKDKHTSKDFKELHMLHSCCFHSCSIFIWLFIFLSQAAQPANLASQASQFQNERNQLHNTSKNINNISNSNTNTDHLRCLNNMMFVCKRCSYCFQLF